MLKHPKVSLPNRDGFGDPLIFSLIRVMDYDARYSMDDEMLQAVAEVFDHAIKHKINLFFPYNSSGKSFDQYLQEKGYAKTNPKLYKLFMQKKSEFRKLVLPREKFDLRHADRLALKRQVRKRGRDGEAGGSSVQPDEKSPLKKITPNLPNA